MSAAAALAGIFAALECVAFAAPFPLISRENFNEWTLHERKKERKKKRNEGNLINSFVDSLVMMMMESRRQ